MLSRWLGVWCPFVAMDELLSRSAIQLADFIRRGEVSSLEVVEAHIAAIERCNPRINAVVATRFEVARAEAQAADEQLGRSAEGLGVFHGVPCTIKESFALEGMPNTAGLVTRQGRVADEDATAVARLRAAGAIPLGVTNVSELCMWLESSNRVYGRTANPYDAARIPGGSSGGEGAIVGAGASPIGLGADIGGSIRLPAFFCGAFGHKPTGGMVPGTGQFPIAENDALRYMTTGPIVRRAEDLHPFLKVIAGPDGIDPECREFDLGDPAGVAIDHLSVVYVADNGVTPVSAELRAAHRRCADHLDRGGARVREAQIPGLRRSFEIWGAMLGAASDTSFSELLGEGEAIGVARELARWAFGRSPHTLAALGLAAVEKVPLFHGRRGAALVAAGQQLQQDLEAVIGAEGVMLFPVYPEVAPRHHVPLLRPHAAAYTAIINVMELPSTQVPLGLNENGLPLGVQVVGARGNDHLTIAVAAELEHAFGGWVPPP